jgi:hypothetical protein
MNGCIFKFVFLFSVEYDAIIIQESHDRGFPTGASQEIYNNIKEPILHTELPQS